MQMQKKLYKCNFLEHSVLVGKAPIEKIHIKIKIQIPTIIKIQIQLEIQMPGHSVLVEKAANKERRL